MLEVVCQGAKLAAYPPSYQYGSQTLSAFVEIGADGQLVGRTRRHELGERQPQPRWDDCFSLPSSSRALGFRVCVGSGQSDVICGEGGVDLQALLLRQAEGPSSVQLSCRGEPAGLLYFSFRPLQAPTRHVPPSSAGGPYPDADRMAGAGVSSPSYPAKPQDRRAGYERRPSREPQQALARVQSAEHVTYGQPAESVVMRGPSTDHPGLIRTTSRDRDGNVYSSVTGRSLVRGGSDGLARTSSAEPTLARASSVEQANAYADVERTRVFESGYPHPQQAQSRMSPAELSSPSYHGYAQGRGVRASSDPQNYPVGGYPDREMALGGAAHGDPAVKPQEVMLPQSAIHRNITPPGGFRDAGTPAPSDGATPVPESANDGRREVAAAGRRKTPPPALKSPRRPSLTPSCISIGGAASPAADRGPMQKEESGIVKRDNSTSGNRLTITPKAKQEISELMSSKDKMRHYTERPFQGKGPNDYLTYEEFKEALTSTLQEMEISVPSDMQIQQLFDKHQKTGKGVGQDEFEALLFRLLCFMRASKEVKVEKVKTPQAAEERDKHWRQEFLARNPRRFDEVYEIQKTLGRGTFGSVYRVAHKSQRGKKNEKRIRVCKIISKQVAKNAGTSDHRVREELAVLKALDHPHVLRIFEDFEDDEQFYLIMEPCYGGDLQEYVRKMPPMEASEYEYWVAKVMQHTLSAIAYCHAKGVIHKDLKPENVMMSTERDTPVAEMHVVVVDFGLSEVFSDPNDRSTIISGTPPFMAPEVWDRNFNKSCDIWSCGVMLFFLLSGRLPFMASRVEDFPRQLTQEPDWKLMGGATPDAHELCRKALTYAEHHRPTAQDCLKSRWFFNMGLVNPESNGAKKALEKKEIDALMKVGQRTEFEKFVTRLVATQVDASQQKRVNEAFRAFDRDGDGLLSREELRQGLLQFGHSEEHVDQVVDELDVGMTGRISYTEFLAGIINVRGRKSEEQDKLLWIAWQQFSPDEQGRVKTSDVQDALAARGMTVADLPDKFIEELRRDASGYMTFEGFKKLMSKDTSSSVMSHIMTAMTSNTRSARLLRWFLNNKGPGNKI